MEKQAGENARQAERLAKVSTQLTAEHEEIVALKVDRDRERAQRAAFEARLSALEQTTRPAMETASWRQLSTAKRIHLSAAHPHPVRNARVGGAALDGNPG